MEPTRTHLLMLANLTGDLCLLVGMAVLLLPLLATELSRPRDGLWGAVVLLLGLVLVTSSDLLRGSPMLAVVCGTLLIGRLGSEVAQSRWHQLSSEEKQRLSSRERWITSVQQLLAAMVSLGNSAGAALTALKPSPPTSAKPEGTSRTGKRWVRPETEDTTPEPSSTDQAESTAPEVHNDTTVASLSAPEPLEAAEINAPSEAAEAAVNAETITVTADPVAAKRTSPESALPTHSAPSEKRGKGFGSPRVKGKGKRWVRPEPKPATSLEPPSDADITTASSTVLSEPSGDDPEAETPMSTGED